jgi:hypothetical protein
MKLVEMRVDLKPYHRGKHVPLPDEIADRLVTSGEAVNPRPWRGAREPEIADLPMLTTPLRQPDGKFKPRRRYLTK